MLGFATLHGPVRGAAVVGTVLAEAGALYLGYGALNRAVAPALADALGGE